MKRARFNRVERTEQACCISIGSTVLSLSTQNEPEILCCVGGREKKVLVNFDDKLIMIGPY